MSKEQASNLTEGENVENEENEEDESEEEVETTQKQFEKVALAEPTTEEGEETQLPEKIDNRKKASVLEKEPNGKQPDTNQNKQETENAEQQANREENEDEEEDEERKTPIVIDTNKIAQTVKLRLEKKHNKSNINSRKRNIVKSKAKKAIREQVSGGY